MNLVTVPFLAPQVEGLGESEQAILNQLIRVWQAKRPRNTLRQAYVDMKAGVDFSTVDIPAHLAANLNVVMGWPGKAVTELANRISWEGPLGGSDQSFVLRRLLDANNFSQEFRQSTESALTQSLSFWVVRPSASDRDDFPMVRSYSAENAAALWDWGKREISAGLTVTQTNYLNVPAELHLYLPGRVLQIGMASNSTWHVTDQAVYPFNHVPMYAMPYNPSLLRPFGRSRVNRQVMSLTDRAIRAGLRMDVSAEFYMAPFFMLLGAEQSAFEDGAGNMIPAWDWIMGHVKAISRDVDGNLPQVFQSSQQTMEPYIAQMRQLAAEFSSATSIPVSSLGVVDTSTNSSLVFNAAREDLIIDAKNTIDTFGQVLKRVYRDALFTMDGHERFADSYLMLDTKWMNPARPSIVSQSDAMVKQVSAIPWLAETTVALEELGYSTSQIDRLLAEKRRAEGGSVLDRLAGLAPKDRVMVDDLGQSDK